MSSSDRYNTEKCPNIAIAQGSLGNQGFLATWGTGKSRSRAVAKTIQDLMQNQRVPEDAMIYDLSLRGRIK